MNTNEIITKGMLKLLRSYSYEEITVQMILDEAHVSRSTFYRYYRDKFDLMNQYYKAHVYGLCEKHDSWENCLIEIYHFLYDNRAYFLKTLDINDPQSFWNFLYDFSFKYTESCYKTHSQQKELTEKERVEIEFSSIGHVFIAKQWLKKGSKVPAETMAKWAYQLTPEKYRNFLDPCC